MTISSFCTCLKPQKHFCQQPTYPIRCDNSTN